MIDLETTDKAAMPRQKVSRSVKDTTKWKHDCIDAVIATTKHQDSIRRRSLSERKRNYDLFNNRIDADHFKHITNPFNNSQNDANTFKLPATLQPYDILFPIFNVLFGEEHKRFFNPIVRAVNDTAVREKEETAKQAVLQQLLQFMADPSQPSEEFLKKAQMSLKDMREETASMFLAYYKKKFQLKDTFAKGWKHWLLAGEEFYDIKQVAGEVDLRCVNPLQIYFVLPENSDSVQEASQILEENWMTINEIIDEFYEVLTPSQIDELENYFDDPFLGQELMHPFSIRSVDSLDSFQNEENTANRIPVRRVRWKTFRKVGMFYYIDPQTGKEESMLVDETWRWDKEDPMQRVEWFWVNEYYEGVKIGSEMYLDKLTRRRPQQFRSMDNLSKCKSGYTGRICSALNSVSTSLMDRLVPWIYLYFITWYDTELALSTNIGKIGLIDVSTMPDGWDVEKWFYYARAMKIGFVNSMGEGNKRAGLSQNQSQLNKEMNLEMGNYIQFNITLLQEIERKIQNTAGVPPERLGAIDSREQVGNVDRSIVQSSLVTEDLFRMHTMTKLDTCTAILEVAKDVYKTGSKSLQFVTDDLQEIIFQIDGETFNSADYGLFLTDDNKDMQVLEAMQSHVKFALQNDQMAFYQIADLYTSESVAQVRAELKQYYLNKREEMQAAQQQEAELTQAQIEAENQRHEELLLMQKYKTDMDNATKVQVASIGVYSRQLELDLDQDGIPDPVELAAQALDQHKVASDNFINKLKLQVDTFKVKGEQELKKKELKLKEKEIKSKERIAENKDRTALQVARQNKNKHDK
jgi:hypothetical protein